MDYKDIIGYVAAAIAIASYLIYFWGIYIGKTKPHAFTWFVWGTLNVIGFAAVMISGAGEGGWVLAVNVAGCYGIAAVGFYQGYVKYDRYDWYALIGAFIGMFLWWQTSNPFYAVLLIAISDFIGFIPSFRKAYRAPHEENTASFALGVTYYIAALFALDSFTPTTSLYHLAVIAWDSAFVILILVRRKQLAKQKAPA